jgi:hypothetical protein
LVRLHQSDERNGLGYLKKRLNLEYDGSAAPMTISHPVSDWFACTLTITHPVSDWFVCTHGKEDMAPLSFHPVSDWFGCTNQMKGRSSILQEEETKP